MNVLLLMTTSENVINFRKSLIEDLIINGFSVTVVACDEERKNEIVALGAKFYSISNSNRSINPFRNLSYKRQLIKLFNTLEIDIVFTFQVKPNIFGTMAAKKVGVRNVFSMIEGAGDVFLKSGLKWHLIRIIVSSLYKRALRYSKIVYFLNHDDRKEFVEKGLVESKKTKVIHGIGVDLNHFSFKPLKNNNVFLMISRMLKTKGVIDFCECARIVKQKYPDVVFNYLGSEGDIKIRDLSPYLENGYVNYLGVTTDVRPFLEESSALLLPSYYREGLPMAIMEAESTGRAIITTNSIGCKDTIIDGYNGFLVNKNDAKEMAEKCIYLIEHQDDLILFGKNSRLFAAEHFDCKKINSYLIESIKEHLILNNKSKS